ncbi:coiled-coil domain-containing protein 191-like [Glandiceps talaboti]
MATYKSVNSALLTMVVMATYKSVNSALLTMVIMATYKSVNSALLTMVVMATYKSVNAALLTMVVMATYKSVNAALLTMVVMATYKSVNSALLTMVVMATYKSVNSALLTMVVMATYKSVNSALLTMVVMATYKSVNSALLTMVVMATYKSDELFDQPVGRQTESGPSTSRSDSSFVHVHSREHKPLEKPRFAWQVSRKHVNLTCEQLSNSDGDSIEANNARLDRDVAVGGKTNTPIPYTVNNFQHRYAAQQKILQEQQRQLKEQQRLIMNLQATQEQQRLYHELNVIRGTTNTVYKTSNVEEVSQTEMEGYQHDSTRSVPFDRVETTHDDYSSGNTSVNNAKKIRPPSNFVKGMEERAARIAQRRAETDERKRRKEEEKSIKIREQEEKMKQEEELEKKAKMEKIREQKRLAKQKEAERQRRLQVIARQNEQADQHYRHILLNHKGMKPWLRLIQMSHDERHRAEDHYNLTLIGKCFIPWKEHVQEIVREKEIMADELYRHILLRRTFASWKRYDQLQSIQLQKARRHFVYNMRTRYFRYWQQFVIEERLAMMSKEEMALDHSQYRIVKTAFYAWMGYPKMIKLEKEKQKRREELRKKVQAILPDFGMT